MLPFQIAGCASSLRPGFVMFKCRFAFLLAVGGVLALSVGLLPGATYYVDSAAGNDTNSGTSSNAAWQTLTKVNATTFSASDSLLLKSGGSWTGTLWPKGSGATNNVITINAYGGGAKPVIDGGGAADAVFLMNQEFWEINNLEVVNDAVADAERRGIHITGSNYVNTVIDHVHVKNCYVHNIRGILSVTDGDTVAKRTGGIIVEVLDDSPTPTRFNDILIEGNTITTVRNQGIVAAGNRSAQNDFPGTAAWDARKVSNLVIRSNTISDVTKNALILRLADSTCLVERNVCFDTATLDTGNTMFTASCDGAVFQYNEGYRNLAGDHDGSLYDADLRSVNIVFQYSYSHDNTHGLFWNYPSASGANSNIIVRYNISQNDRGNIFSFSGDAGASATTYIYNNVVYLPSGSTNYLFDSRSGVHTLYAWNNIFHVQSTNVIYDLTNITATFDYNVFYGQHPASEPADAHKLTSDPLLVAPGTGTNGLATLSGYQLQTNSPCRDSGTNIAGNGGLDFFGNAVPFNSTADRGAHELIPIAPAISQQPTNIAAVVGANVSFSVTAGGTPAVTYQWLKNGVAISGATNAALNFSSAATNDTGSFSVVVSNIVGVVTSSVVTLVVADPNNFTATRFSAVTTTSGVNYTTVTNFYNTVQTLALDVYQPTGDTSSNRPAVMWVHGGGLRTGSSKTQSYIVTYSQEFAKRGYVCFSIDYRVRNGSDMPTAELELPALQDAAHDANTALAWIRSNAPAYKLNTNFLFVGGGSAGGIVGCVVDFHEGPDTNICASCSSAPTANAPNNQYPFTDWNRGGVVAFADLWGSPESPKRWYALDSNDVPATIIHGTADTTLPYTNSTALADGLQAAGANYYLNPIAGANHTPTTYNSTIIPWMANFFAREWNKKFSGANGARGVDALTQTATGIGQNSATLNGALIPANASGKFYFQYGTTTNYGSSMATNTVVASLSATNVSAAITGLTVSTLYHYRVVLTNAAGVKSGTDATFTTSALGNTPPGITTQPQAQTACAGGAASFTVTATGSTPLSYQWLKAGVTISNATNATVNLSAITTNDAVNYSVIVTNAFGSVTSSVAALTVNVAPAVTSQPQSLTNNTGTSATFSVTATGTATLTYQWRKGGANLSGATSASYTNSSVTGGDAGNYDVVVANSCGSVTSAVAVLTVTGPPTITAQPQSVTTNAGSAATFSVTAGGTAPLAYQWRFAGANVPSATNSIHAIASVATNDAGNYSVVVTNAFGAVTSSIATLTVTVGSSGSSTGAVVIAEVYNGGGKTGASFNRDFVVLKNTSSASVTISNWSLQHDKAGVWQTPLVLTNYTIPPGGYFLIQCYYDGGAAVGTALSPDSTTVQSSAWNFSTSAGGAVALVNNTNTLQSCSSNIIVDLVGFVQATSTNCYEGAGVAPGGNATQSNQRASTGCQDSNDNAADFALGTPNPRNLSSSAQPCCVAPAISAQPSGQTVSVGGSISFSVAAFGTAPLAYQWRKDGAGVTGATNGALSFTASAVSAAGNYDVIITNTCGSMTSSVAALAVNKAVPSLGVVSSQNPVAFHANLTFTSTVTGGGVTPTGSVQFKTNSSAFGATASLAGGAATSGSTTNLPRGTNPIAAEYSGDANYFAVTNTAAQGVTNTPPVAQLATYTRGSGISLKMLLVSLATNWSDVDGDTVSLDGASLTTTNGGALATNATTLFYANANNVADLITFTIRDSHGDAAPGRVAVVIEASSGQGQTVAFTDGVMRVVFAGIPGREYSVQRSLNLTNWVAISVITAPGNGVFEVIDDFSDTGPPPASAYYRLLAQ